MKNLIAALFAFVFSISHAFADPTFTCVTKRSDTQSEYWSMTVRGTVSGDLSTGKSVDIVSWVQTKNPNYIPSRTGSVSNTDKEQPNFYEYHERVSYAIDRVVSDGAFHLYFAGGGASIRFVGSEKANLIYTAPGGPEIGRIFNSCTFLNPEVGFTVGN